MHSDFGMKKLLPYGAFQGVHNIRIDNSDFLYLPLIRIFNYLVMLTILNLLCLFKLHYNLDRVKNA